MKQKKLISLALASLLLLSGCTSKTVQEDGKDVVASIDESNLLADDLYQDLASSTQGKQALFSYVLDQLIRQNFPATDDMEENADELVENIETNFQNQHGDSAEEELQSALESAGVKNMAEYRDSLIQSLQYAEFLKKYVNDHFDEVFEDYYQQATPRTISLIKVSISDPENPTDQESEKLKEVQSLLKTNKSFDEIAYDYSDDDNTKSAKGNLGIVDTSTDLSSTYGKEVQTMALTLKEGEVSEMVQGSDGNYFLKCTSTNQETIKKELKTVDVDSPLLTYDDYMVYLAFQTYEIEYHDDTIKQTIQDIVDENLKIRDDLRKENA